MLVQLDPERYLDTALHALSDNSDWRRILDELPVPIYVTDSEGSVTYWNRACVELVGREPQLGQDRWCVTWKLYTELGDFLPHDQCPMAEAVKTQQQVRGVIAVAERPDGSRVTFQPYPTPLYAPDGSFRGAVNMLLDITDSRQAASLRAQAARCRRLARSVNDRPATEALNNLADEYDVKARRLEQK
jgi:PAS domain S-box-containing protein